MEITASSVPRKQFTKRQRGYDSKEVSSYLDQVATVMAAYERDLNQLSMKIDQLQTQLVDAKQAEEAVNLTILAASRAKEEMLHKAQTEADRMVAAAVEDAAAIREESELVEAASADVIAEAREQAVRIVAEADLRVKSRLDEADNAAQERIAVARREALALLDDTRVDAEQLINAAIAEEGELQERLEELRMAIELVEEPLRAVASGAVQELMALKEIMPERVRKPVAAAPTDVAESGGTDQPAGLEVVQDFEIVRTVSTDRRKQSKSVPNDAELEDDAQSLMELAYAESDL